MNGPALVEKIRSLSPPDLFQRDGKERQRRLPLRILAHTTPMSGRPDTPVAPSVKLSKPQPQSLVLQRLNCVGSSGLARLASNCRWREDLVF